MPRRNPRELDVAESLVHMALPGEDRNQAAHQALSLRGDLAAGAHGQRTGHNRRLAAPHSRYRSIRPALTPMLNQAPAHGDALQNHLIRQQLIAGIAPENIVPMPQRPQGNANVQTTPNLINISNTGVHVPWIPPATFIPRTRYPEARNENDHNQGNNARYEQFLTVPGERPLPHELIHGHHENPFNAPLPGAIFGPRGFQGFAPAFPTELPPFDGYNGGHRNYVYQPGHPVSNERGAPETDYDLPPYVKEEPIPEYGHQNMINYPAHAPDTILLHNNYGPHGPHGLPDLNPYHTDAIVINPIQDPPPPYVPRDGDAENTEATEATVAAVAAIQTIGDSNELQMQRWNYLRCAASIAPEYLPLGQARDTHRVMKQEPIPSIEDDTHSQSTISMPLDCSHSQSTISMPLDRSHSQSTISMPLEPFEFDRSQSIANMPSERSIILDLLQHPELAINITEELSPSDLINLWCTSKALRVFLVKYLPQIIQLQTMRKCRTASHVFPWRCYQKLWFRRFAGHNELDPQRMINIDPTVPVVAYTASLRWLQMIRYRERTVRKIIDTLCAANCGFPRRYKAAILKLWFIMDIPDTPRRIWTVQNKNLWTDLDLFMAIFFIVRIDMFVKIQRKCASGGQRRLIMAQPSLTFCLDVVTGTAIRDNMEYLSALVRWRYNPRPEELASGEPIFGVPISDIGSLQYEGYGSGRSTGRKLRRPDDLILREAVRRKLKMNDMYRRIFLHSQPEKYNLCERPGIPWDREARLKVEADGVDIHPHGVLRLDKWPV